MELDAVSHETTIRVVIAGRVQGVGYRHWTAGTARDLGLDGWVRNRRDGTVEALFRGPDDAIERMLTACRSGPGSARVDTIERLDANADEAGDGGFEQRGTV